MIVLDSRSLLDGVDAAGLDSTVLVEMLSQCMHGLNRCSSKSFSSMIVLLFTRDRAWQPEL